MSDPISSFGGVVACNYKINNRIAIEINKKFIWSWIVFSEKKFFLAVSTIYSFISQK